jgi:hypothetical protein
MKKKPSKKQIKLKKLTILPLEMKYQEKIFGMTGTACPTPVTSKCTNTPIC